MPDQVAREDLKVGAQVRLVDGRIVKITKLYFGSWDRQFRIGIQRNNKTQPCCVSLRQITEIVK